MTRFARASGSKSSNKRIREEATPWEQLKPKKIKVDSEPPSKGEGKKKKKNKNKSSINNKHGFITENGQRYKIFKGGTKKPWIDIPYEENEIMTLYNKFFVKKEAVEKLNSFKKSLEEQGHPQKEIDTKMMTNERRAHNKLRVQLMYNQINTIKGENGGNMSFSKTPKMKSNLPEENFKESECMAKYEGYWVSRKNVGHLKKIRELKISRIIESRDTGNSEDLELNEPEMKLLNKQMKKEKRRVHRLLCEQIQNGEIESELDVNQNGYNNQNQIKSNKNCKEERSNFSSDNNHYKGKSIVKFDGYSVPKDSAERLTSLRDELYNKNFSENEVKEAIKLERRKEERDWKKSKKLICFKCREPGHTVAQCRETENVEICYKCGSTEHMARNCSKQASFDHAQCFYCTKTGHLARECPDNPNGLYPDGGSCRECSSIHHLARDCPTAMENKGSNYATIRTMNAGDNPEEMFF